MTSISETRPQPALPQLPHWETTPSDLREATRAVKSAIRSRIAASGRSVEEVLAKVEALVRSTWRRSQQRRLEGAVSGR